jgi:hypothetical protein
MKVSRADCLVGQKENGAAQLLRDHLTEADESILLLRPGSPLQWVPMS